VKIAIVGRLTPIKNHHMFLEVLEALRARGLAFSAYVIGDGELRADLAREVAALGLAGHVVFTGWIRDLGPAYSAIDYLFLTSRNEGTPVAILEAMAAGKFVIATAVGGVGDLVRDGANGFLVPDSGPESFVRRFLEAHSLAESAKARIAQAARETAAAYSVERLLSNIDMLYRGGSAAWTVRSERCAGSSAP
jgi:glycosyltransferase involved in cell wall biosynthesis